MLCHQSEGLLALTDRMLLMRDLSIPVAFVVFDVLSLGGDNTLTNPYWQRREVLETLNLAAPIPRLGPVTNATFPSSELTVLQ